MSAFVGGLIFIDQRNVLAHQRSMIGGLILVGSGLVLFMTDRLLYGPLLPPTIEAYGLLLWILVGLTVVCLLAGGLAYWCMVERSWSLHRRSGMYAVFSGSGASAVHLLLLVIKLWMT